MNKIRTLIKAPILTNSGYGVHSRQIFRALASDPMFDVSVESLRWGQCSYLIEETDEVRAIKKCVEKRLVEKNQGVNKYDLFVHVSIPNEFEKLGTFNIGITAGIETDRVSHVWVQKCQEMDLIIVPSEHSRDVLCRTEVVWENPQTHQKGTFKLQKPVIVCSEGVDTSIFHKFVDEPIASHIDQLLSDAPEFNFLTVGQWGQGGFGQDRKNIALLVKYFIESFSDRDDVGLVLKVNMARNSVIDYNACVMRLNEIKSVFTNNPAWGKKPIPPIRLIHATLTDQEMASLYNHPKIKAFVSFTHGEGFGLPLLEAAACELPIIATNWSGHLDFLNKGKFSAVKFEMKEIPPPAVWPGVMDKGFGWAEVTEDDAKHRLKKMVDSYSVPRSWAKDLAEKIKEEFDISVVCEHLLGVIKMGMKRPEVAPQMDPIQALREVIDTPNDYNVLFTMPRSTGDVFIATAVLSGLKLHLPENAKLYFATEPQYADVLKGNPNVYKIIPWNQTMMTTDVTEEVFDLVFTPDTATQYMFSNWIHRGDGTRNLAKMYANHCDVELGDYFIERDDSIYSANLLDANYMTIHTTSSKDQWGARKYVEWQEVIDNIKRYVPNLKVVQIGLADETLLKNVDVDLRGKTTPQQLASVIEHSTLHLGVDSFPVHLCAMFNTPVVALYGSSYARSTGPWYKDLTTAKFILLETDNRLGCNKACYKNECKMNKELPCINCIDPFTVFQACAKLLKAGE
jgi:ADP-heptose:LPS heptosyltransferase/glycosyltransferase involved in cell wall biosynthesis